MRGPIRGFRTHVAWVVASVVVAAGVLYAMLDFADGLPTVGDPYRVTAVLPTAVSLAPGATVSTAGIDIGKVVAIHRRGDGAAVELQIDDEHAPLPADTRVEVRLRTLLGENYVSLHRGSTRAASLPDGAELPRRQAVEAVQLDEILSVLDKDGRADARRMIRGFGQGLEGGGARLNGVLEDASGEVRAASGVFDVLARNRVELSRFVDRFGQVYRAFEDRGAAIRALARDARTTVTRVGRRDAAVRALIDELQPTLARARATSSVLRRVTATTAPVVAELATAVRRAEPVVDQLPRAAGEGRAVFTRLGSSAPPLRRMLTELRRLSEPGREAMPAVRRTLCEFNPLMRRVSPYGRDAGALLANAASMVNWSDKSGWAERELAMLDQGSMSVIGRDQPQLVQDLLSAGFFSPLVRKGYNAYPKPGEGQTPVTGHGRVGPEDDEAPYERVSAEC